MRNRGDVLDGRHFKTDVLQRADGRLAARSGALDEDLEPAQTVLHGPAGAGLGGQLRSERRRLAAALEPDVAGRGPCEDVDSASVIDTMVLLNELLMCATPLTTFYRSRLRGRRPPGFGLAMSYFLGTFFLPATVFFGPLRVRALVWVR